MPHENTVAVLLRIRENEKDVLQEIAHEKQEEIKQLNHDIESRDKLIAIRDKKIAARKTLIAMKDGEINLFQTVRVSYHHIEQCVMEGVYLSPLGKRARTTTADEDDNNGGAAAATDAEAAADE